MKLAEKWHRPYIVSDCISFVTTRFAIFLVRAKNRCLRDSRILRPVEFRIVWIGKTEQQYYIRALFYLGILLKLIVKVLNPFSLFLFGAPIFSKKRKITLNVT